MVVGTVVVGASVVVGTFVVGSSVVIEIVGFQYLEVETVLILCTISNAKQGRI